MRILVISEAAAVEKVSSVGVTGINIQLFQILVEWARLGHDVAMLPIVRSDPDKRQTAPMVPERFEPVTVFAALTTCDVSVPRKSLSGTLVRLVRTVRSVLSLNAIGQYYPTIDLGREVSRCADEFRADILFSFISPLAAGAMARANKYPKIIFQGDIDHVPDKVRFANPELFRQSGDRDLAFFLRWWRRLARRGRLKSLERHARVVALAADAIAVTAACSISFYEMIGHQNVKYVGTTWPDSRIAPRENQGRGQRDGSPGRPFKIIGHVSYLNMTASAFGLAYLLRDVVPALRQEMAGLDFEVHIIGDGSPPEILKPYLGQDNIVLRGYIDDLDAELLDSDVFLFLNNVGPLKAIFSRQIMAWALGLCLIVHEGSLQTLPEMVPGENALVGGSPEELAALVKQACLDENLNDRVRRGGRLSYERYFTPMAIAEKLIEVMDEVVSSRREGGQRSVKSRDFAGAKSAA